MGRAGSINPGKRRSMKMGNTQVRSRQLWPPTRMVDGGVALPAGIDERFVFASRRPPRCAAHRRTRRSTRAFGACECDPPLLSKTDPGGLWQSLEGQITKAYILLGKVANGVQGPIPHLHVFGHALPKGCLLMPSGKGPIIAPPGTSKLPIAPPGARTKPWSTPFVST